MKKVLFLSFNYPEGGFGPSTLCTTRVMRELCETKQCEVHCISYEGAGKNVYDSIAGVVIHKIGLKPYRHTTSVFLIHLMAFLKIPFFPFVSIIDDIKHYRACKHFLRENVFDLVIAQYATEQSLLSGVLLKKQHYINSLMVLFWDNIYGKKPRRVIPSRFANRRQFIVENWVAKYADSLVSLYPIKSFHEVQGDVPNAKGKRYYLGIPSIVRPKSIKNSSYQYLIKTNKINMVYSGTIFKIEHFEYFVKLLNKTNFASDINLIIFTRSVSKDYISSFQGSFSGSIEAPGYIPVDELLSLYPSIDFFISFPGAPTAICSKVFEYMSYEKPLILLYEDDLDVNVSTFSRYPYCESIDYRLPLEDNVMKIDNYITIANGKTVPFNIVENLFPNDTAASYVKMIINQLQ